VKRVPGALPQRIARAVTVLKLPWGVKEVRLQLVGPMTGLPDFNYPLFNEVAARLRAEGHQVWNPAEENLLGETWSRCMRESLAALQVAEAVVLLPNWAHSRGANLEVETALALDIPIIPWAAWDNLAIMP